MQWGIDGKVNWSAPRHQALASIPLIYLVIGSTIYFRSETGSAPHSVSSLAFFTVTIIAVHLFSPLEGPLQRNVSASRTSWARLSQYLYATINQPRQFWLVLSYVRSRSLWHSSLLAKSSFRLVCLAFNRSGRLAAGFGPTTCEPKPNALSS